MRHTIRHALTYLGVYGVCTVLDVGVVALTHLVLGWPLLVAVALGFTTNVGCGFVLGRVLVFPGARTRLRTASWRYALLTAFNVLVGVGGVTTVASYGVNYALARIGSSGLLLVVNYVLMRWWVFDARHPRPLAAAGTGAVPGTGGR